MTIPVMKRTGVHGGLCRRDRACASTGAVLAPPVMGATAFRDGAIPRRQLRPGRDRGGYPAALYYFGLFLQVDAYAARHGLEGHPRSGMPRLWDAIKEGWYYAFAIVLLDVHAAGDETREAMRRSTPRCCCWCSTRRSTAKVGPRQPSPAFSRSTARPSSELVGILAGCGLLIGAFSVTGVISSLANDLLAIAGNNAAASARDDRADQPGARPRAHHHRLLHLPRHPGRAGAGEGGTEQDGGAHVRVLLGHALFDHAPVAIASFRRRGHRRVRRRCETGWASMRVGSIIYFIPFFFVLNPAFVLQGPW